MKKIPLIILCAFSLSLVSISCNNNKLVKDRIIVGISEDLESLNPLYSFSVNEGNITELLFLPMVKHTWNNKIGDLEASPMLARNWEWAKDSSFLILELRNDVKWSDGINTTVDDVVFSFDVYSDPLVQSRLLGTFKNFNTNLENHINVEKTFIRLSDNKLKINFKSGSIPSLFDIDFPVIPKHIFEKISRKEIQTAKENFNPVTNGPFRLKKWERNQSIILAINRNSFLYNPACIKELIFKIVPDYNSRINQIKNGEIDVTEDIKTDDINRLKENGNIEVASIKGREYDYIGWNNIDVKQFSENKRSVPNKLFGDRLVRIALSIASNRKEILEEFLGNYGELAFSPVTPIFNKALNVDIKPYQYDVRRSKELLKQAGWQDIDNDGVLEKKDQKFSFTLYIPAGNPRREYAATIIKNNLKQVGIDVTIEKVELGVFIDNLYQKKYDAWMAGWSVPVPVDLRPYWYSDLENTPLNLVSFQNKGVDSLIILIEKEKSVDRKNNLYKIFQKKIHDDEPVTFLYWIDNPVAFNKKIRNMDIDPLGAVHYCWNWTVQE
jgi:peptide/nickel transport system substrate-binding protein